MSSRLFPFLASLPLFLLLTTTQAEIYCYPSVVAGPDGPRPKPPSLLDCRLLLAHLPSNPPATSHNASLTSSSSLPFLPRAFLRHSTCDVVIHYGHVDPFIPPSTPPILDVFGAMKATGEQVLQQCVDGKSRLGGIGVGVLQKTKWTVVVAHQLRGPVNEIPKIAKSLMQDGEMVVPFWPGGDYWAQVAWVV